MNLTRKVLFVTLTCVVIACDEAAIDQTPELPDFWEQHHQQIWTETSTSERFLGSWKWTYVRCCPESLQPFAFENTEDEELVLQFDPGILSVFQRGVLIQQSIWSLEIRDGDLFGLVADPFVNNTHGRILFAEDWVQFNGSYVDGADNYFRKIED